MVAIGGEAAIQAVVSLLTDGLTERLVITVPCIAATFDGAIAARHLKAHGRLSVFQFIGNELAIRGQSTRCTHGTGQGPARLHVLARRERTHESPQQHDTGLEQG